MSNIVGRESSVSDARTKTKKKDPVSEYIKFNEGQGEFGYAFREDSTLVHVYPSRSTQKLPESKLRIRNLVDYSWDISHGTGRLISTHLSGKFLAYVLKVSSSGGVRIVDLETHERVLIKGSRGQIKDVEFMHKIDDLIVAFIDEYGTVYIYKITKDMEKGSMETFLILEVSSEVSPEASEFRRFIWCQFVPDDTLDAITPRDGSYHFAVLHNDKVYVANLCQLIEKYGEGKHSLHSFKDDYMLIESHTANVLDASFAPDGTALCTASEDGTVKFFQVYLVGSESSQGTRCLYSWSPHGGSPVTKIFFLDDHSWNTNNLELVLHNNHNGQYWKYMITAGPNMSEIKLWTCKQWVCLQTIKFCCPTPSQLKMCLNITADILVLTDVHRKSMFVINISSDETTAKFAWIAEFSLPCSVLSFNINSARLLSQQEFESTGYDDYVANELDSPEYCVLDISYVQPKSLQQGLVAFIPPSEVCPQNTHGPGKISFDTSISYIEGKSGEMSDSPVESSDDEILISSPIPKHKSPSNDNQLLREKSVSPSHPRTASPKSPHQSATSALNLSQQLSNLLLHTGPSFSNGIKGSSEVASNNDQRARSLPPGAQGLNNKTGFSPGQSSIEREQQENMPNIRRESPNRLRLSSGSSQASSSPSREVEEILSPKTTEHNTHHVEISQNVDEILTVNNFDMEGNVLENCMPPFQYEPQQLSLSPKGESGQYPQVLEQMNSIIDLVQAQAHEMRELKHEVSVSQAVSARQIDETTMCRILDKYFSEINFRVQRLEDYTKSLHADERQRPSAAQLLPPNFGETITSNIGNLLKKQMETIVLPSILTLFEPVRTQVQAELVKMVLNSEGRIKQELKQLISSPEFKNSLQPDLENSVKSVCENIIPRVLVTSIVPNFEKALNSMYVKINETFMQGTREYMGGVVGTMESRRAQEVSSQEEMKDQLSSMQDNISSVLQVELESQMLRGLSNLQTTLLKQIEETVVRELTRSFREQQKYFELSILPRAVTPALSVSDHHTNYVPPPPDPEAIMKQLFKMVEKGDITGAFVQASHYADSVYLMRLAEKANPNLVFSGKLPSQTHVAIIQQMASDMMQYTETKIAYLNVALATLNISEGKVLKSLGRIIPVFQAAIKKYAEQNPGSPNIQGLKLLEMAFNGICSPRSQASASGGSSFH